MMIYQKLFAEYGQMAAQVLITRYTVTDPHSRKNAYNTFRELLKLGAIPIVNDNLSAIVASLMGADLLILLSDIDGLFTDDPHQNPKAEFIDVVEKVDDHFLKMGKSTSGSAVGTGGMSAKLSAAKIAVSSGADMVIANGEDFHIIHRIIHGEKCGTLFVAQKEHDFSLKEFLEKGNEYGNYRKTDRTDQ